MSKRSRDTYDAILGKLRAFGSAYPGAHAKSPWPGHNDLAVNNKTFAYLSAEGDPFSISVKLPYTGYEALKLPFVKPTGYGLGKSGWVTVEPGPGQMPSFDLLKSWIDESYRAQAPKKLARGVTGPDGAARPKKAAHSTTRASMKRPIVTRSRAIDRRNASRCR